MRQRDCFTIPAPAVSVNYTVTMPAFKREYRLVSISHELTPDPVDTATLVSLSLLDGEGGVVGRWDTLLPTGIGQTVVCFCAGVGANTAAIVAPIPRGAVVALPPDLMIESQNSLTLLVVSDAGLAITPGATIMQYDMYDVPARPVVAP